MANQNMYILDENRREVPLETLGEIYIGGRGVAKGYDNDREKTDSAFFNHEEFGRIYRTGDYGRIKREGYMEFCGRRDSQIKMNGHRYRTWGNRKYAAERGDYRKSGPRKA